VDGLGLAADEVQEAGLVVGSLGRVDLVGEGARPAQHRVVRFEERTRGLDAGRVQPLVLTGRPRQVPRVDDRVGAHDPADELLERLRPAHPLHLGCGALGVGQGRLHRVRLELPGGREVLTRIGPGRVTAGQAGQQPPGRVDDVGRDVVCGPLRAR
jgi:hypothetical protein